MKKVTKSLYYDDAWLKSFDALVTGRRKDKTGLWLGLDRTAFYPEGGGQPCDTGTLAWGGIRLQVLEAQRDEQGYVWHRVNTAGEADLPPPGEAVRGEIDWPRRFDHMQQHTGEHILANCVWRLSGGFTHGLHIGAEASSIDVTLPDGGMRLPRETLEEIEALANQRVAEDADIVCRFPGEEELAALPLRKDPTVTGHVRVCSVGGYEMVACGGTHLSRASQVGLVKILSCQPARGKMRLFFLCGRRAAAHYRQCYGALSEACAMLSARPEEVPARLDALMKQAEEMKRELAALRRGATLRKLPLLLAGGVPLEGGGRLIAAGLEEADLPAMEELAAGLIGESGVLALLCVPQGEKTLCLFARSLDRAEDMPRLLKDCGARGGGRPDFARGAAPDRDVLERARGQVLKKNKEA